MVNSLSRATLGFGVLRSSYCHFSKETWGNDWALKWKAVFQQSYAKNTEQMLWLETSNTRGGGERSGNCWGLTAAPQSLKLKGILLLPCETQGPSRFHYLKGWIYSQPRAASDWLYQSPGHDQSPTAFWALGATICSCLSSAAPLFKVRFQTREFWTRFKLFFVIWGKNSVFLWTAVGFREIGS